MMDREELHRFYQRFKFGEDNFHNLMRRRVRHVLLVSSVFDAYVLEQDGRLSEQIMGEYRQLNLSLAPQVTTVTLDEDIPALLQGKDFDMVIIMMRSDEDACFALAEAIRAQHPALPLLLLAHRLACKHLHRLPEASRAPFDEVFLWNGDTTLFLAMIKSVEDRWNADWDVQHGLVQVILLAESSVAYYSMFLPLLYTEIMKQTQALIDLELNDMNKRLRMRARPKVLLAHTAPSAAELFDRHAPNVIGVLTGVHLGNDPGAGLRLIEHIHTLRTDVPLLVQSAEESYREAAQAAQATFVSKQSPFLLRSVRAFLLEHMGFGDFVFRLPEGREAGRAATLPDFERELAVVPIDSLLFHGRRNDFSTWLIARGEMQMAREIRPVRNADFTQPEDLRRFLIGTIGEVRRRQNRGAIISFDPLSLLDDDKIVRLGEGSLGGKGRGLAFLNALLVSLDFRERFPDVRVRLPHTAIIGTAEFDWFMEHNHLRPGLLELSDDDIRRRFVAGELSPELRKRLGLLANSITKPLAVRSSGLLEDSQSQPFAGIYATYMVPNNHPHRRLTDLETAVKLVFASPFLYNARTYIRGIQYQLEEEKMAVIVQEVAGAELEGGLYFPHLAGVAQSYDYYPVYTSHTDGIASLTAGLGKAVVDGERAYRFCPAKPRVELATPEEQVNNAQREFYALDLRRTDYDLLSGEDATLSRERLWWKERQGPFKELTSVWDWENQRFLDSPYAQGARTLTFRSVVHFPRFHLPQVLAAALEIGQAAHGVPVEIEFAVDLTSSPDCLGTFFLLQIRPLTVLREDTLLDVPALNRDDLLLLTSRGLGNGVIDDIADVVWLEPERFDNTRTVEMAEELEKLNRTLREENRPSLLLGPGRWGTRDRFLGVPVRWAQIDRARVMVEVGLPNLPIDASQGSHFFHNLVAMRIGYFSVPHGRADDFIDWAWLKERPAHVRGAWFTHTRLASPLVVRMDGKHGVAAVFKPESKG